MKTLGLDGQVLHHRREPVAWRSGCLRQFTGIDPYVDIDGYSDQVHVVKEEFIYTGKSRPIFCFL